MACVLNRTSMLRVDLALLFQTQMRPTSLSAHWPSDNIDRRAPEFEHLVTSRCYTLSSPGVACVEWSNSRATESTQIYLTVSLHNSRSTTSIPCLQLCCNFENRWNAHLSTTIFIFHRQRHNIIQGKARILNQRICGPQHGPDLKNGKYKYENKLNKYFFFVRTLVQDRF